MNGKAAPALGDLTGLHLDVLEIVAAGRLSQGYVAAAVGLPDDVAGREGYSFARAVRDLVEWGLIDQPSRKARLMRRVFLSCKEPARVTAAGRAKLGEQP